MDRQIFWLSSYPKSGNTLLRSMLIALFFTNDGKFEFEKFYQIEQFERTTLLLKNKNIFGDDFNKLKSIPIIFKYLDKLQSKKLLGLNQDFVFFKSHSGLFEIGGNSFTNKNNTRGIIYLLRDPRDVCLSWSKHNGITINESIKYMINDLSNIYWQEPSSTPEVFKESDRPRSFLSSWEKHVLSWTSIKWKTPILIIKYEDLVYNKEDTILKIINFFEINYKFVFEDKNEKIKNILDSTSFLKLKKQEETKGFIEATKHGRFFSVGKKKQWMGKLNKNQLKLIEQKFGEVMKKFGYNLEVEI